MLLETIESKLQSLLEGTLDRLLFPGASRSLSSQIVSLISEKINTGGLNEKTLPDLFEIGVSPERIDAWKQAYTVLEEAAKQLQASWLENGYYFNSHPRIIVKPNPGLGINEIEIRTATSSGAQLSSRTALQVIPRILTPEAIPEHAYFIINGKETAALLKPIINVGRRSSCDIVLRDPMVSRDHLQLRVEGGKYILFDLGSTAGTYVNNKQVKMTALKPGDVIRIGKTILVYNQDVFGNTETKASILNEPDPS